MNKQNAEMGLMTSLDGTKTITVEEFDKMFDDASDEIDDFVDFSKFEKRNLDLKRVNVDFPQWMIYAMDREARQIGISRQALIKTWISERLEERNSK
jgi:hypothetical protein